MTEQEKDAIMVNEHLNGHQPINSIHLETLANGDSEAEVNLCVVCIAWISWCCYLTPRVV